MTDQEDREVLGNLTERELEIIEHVAEGGVTDTAIYHEVTEATIKRHLRNGLGKLHAGTVEEAMESIRILREEEEERTS